MTSPVPRAAPSPSSPPTATALGAAAVSLDGLTKRFGARAAVDGLTLDIPAGVVAGFIGPNGAGKTTTMAMLLGLVAPTAGTGTVLGHPLGRPAAYLGDVGALIESPALWPGLTGHQNLRVLAALGGHDPAPIPGLLAQVGLLDRAGDRFGEYSLGMKQRLGIAAALLGDPRLLILDEPTNGLDPTGINEMRHLIAALARADRTVIVSSHILAELEQICDWLVVIDEGTLVYQGPAGGFLAQAEAVVVVAPERDADRHRLDRLLRAEGHDVVPDGADLAVTIGTAEPRAVAATLNRLALEHGIVLAELHVRRPTLESHYLATVHGGQP